MMAASAGRFSKRFGPYPAAEGPNLNAGRRVYKDPCRQEICYSCNTKEAVVFVFAPGTSQLPSSNNGYCVRCWSNNPANTPIENIRTR